MSALQDAKHILDRSQGDVRNEDHKRDLQTQALITALIAIAEELTKANNIKMVELGIDLKDS